MALQPRSFDSSQLDTWPNTPGECVALLDGDQKIHKASHTKYFLKSSDSTNDDSDATNWLESRLGFLPGDSWPEWWMFTTLSDYEIDDLAYSLGVPEEELRDLCDVAARAGKHKELTTLSRDLSLPVNDVCAIICKWIIEAVPNEFNNAHRVVDSCLD